MIYLCMQFMRKYHAQCNLILLLSTFMRNIKETMACNCKILKSRLERLQTKYIALRKNHKKLLGFTILLTDLFEDIVRQGVNSELIKELESYASSYPDILGKQSFRVLDLSSNVRTPTDLHPGQLMDENGKVYEPTTESEKEYYEGFLARPKIPRTPQL